MSQSPRPASCRPFAEPASTMFITTDYDRDCISPSSPDSDLIFNMSPIHSHFLPSSPSSPEPVDLMAWRARPQGPARRVTSSPPLSPLLYAFPRPSHPTGCTKQTTGNRHDSPLTPAGPNTGAAPADRRARTSCEPEAGPAVDARPLAASLLDAPPVPAQPGQCPKSAPAPSPQRPARLHAHPSSPIPIPRNKPRRSDPGPFVGRPAPALIRSLDYHDTLASSGIASRGGLGPGGGGPAHASAASRTPVRRIEGFDDAAGGTPEPERDAGQSGASAADSRSPATPSPYAGCGPFRFSSFFDLRLEGPHGGGPPGGKDGRFARGAWVED